MMLGFAITTQVAYGSAVMPGEEDTIYCQFCIDKVVKKSENKPFNLEGFDFSGNDMRKYPTWVGWQPAEIQNMETKSPLEIKMEKDSVTSHGLSRDHILFKVLIDAEETRAKQKIDLDKIQNDDFDKLDNFHTIIFEGDDKDIEKLNLDIKIQSQQANELLQNILSLRNERH